MKKHAKWIAAAVAVTGGLALACSAQAQSVTGDPTLDNFVTRAASFYAGWAPADATVNSSGLTMASEGYGSLYYPVPVANQQVVNSSDTQVSLTFTLNAPSGSYYVGVPFLLDDSEGNTAVSYGGYNTYLSPGTYTETLPLLSGSSGASLQASVTAGGDVINGFNLEFDPAAMGSTTPYSITFDSLSLSSAVPEPGTVQLMGLGLAGAFAFLRRKK